MGAVGIGVAAGVGIFVGAEEEVVSASVATSELLPPASMVFP